MKLLKLTEGEVSLTKDKNDALNKLIADRVSAQIILLAEEGLKHALEHFSYAHLPYCDKVKGEENANDPGLIRFFVGLNAGEQGFDDPVLEVSLSDIVESLIDDQGYADAEERGIGHDGEYMITGKDRVESLSKISMEFRRLADEISNHI